MVNTEILVPFLSFVENFRPYRPRKTAQAFSINKTYATRYMKLTTDLGSNFRLSTRPLRTGSIYLAIS